MSKIKSSKLKLVSAVSAVMFSLVTCFTGVFAWFVSNGASQNKSKEFNIEADPNIMNLQLALYRYNYDDKAGYVTYEDDPDFTFSLNKYDKFLPERNTNNNNILRFEITFTGQLTTSSSRVVSFDFKCTPTKIGDPFDNGIKDGKERKFLDETGYKYTCSSTTYICNKISNVIYFKLLPYTYVLNGQTCKFDDSLNIDETTAKSTYADATAAFADIEEERFVNNKSKVSEFTGSDVEVPAKATSMILYLEYSYNKELIEDFLYPNEFVESPETAEIFTGGVNIDFFKDVVGLFASSEGD